MGKTDQRIQEKLDEWTSAGLITPEQASAIRAREAPGKPGMPWGILIFAGFGAVLLGLGVILLFAYNWAAMPKFAKLGVVFGALAAAHGTGWYLQRKKAARGFADSAFLLGSMLFGAGIWLVAQIYHISAHYPNAFIVWAMGALLLAWALPSVSQGLMASVLIAVWACTEAVSFHSHPLIAPPLVVLGTGWLAWRLRSPVLLAASAAGFVFSSAAGFAYDEDLLFPVLLAVATLLCGLAWVARDRAEFPSAASVFRVTGAILYFPLLFILTFHDAARDLLWWRSCRGSFGTRAMEWLPIVILGLTTLATAGFAVRRAVALGAGNSPAFRGQLLAPLVLFLVYLALWLLPLPLASEDFPLGNVLIVPALAFNAFFLYHTAANLWIGCRETRLRQVVGGSLLLAVWVFARFTDLFDSLLARGAMFVGMGVALFSVAVVYHRLKKKPSLPVAGTAPETTRKEDG